jgi:signal transduction histidine kinase
MENGAGRDGRRRRGPRGRWTRAEGIGRAPAPPAPARAAEPPAAPPPPAAEPGLLAAARRVAAGWPPEEGAAAGAADPWPLLRALAEAAERGSATLAEAAAPGFDRATARRLLDRLRAEAVRGWSAAAAPPPAPRMLAVLAALEALAASLDPSPEERLAARLAETSGRAMVREVAHDLQSPLTSILFLSETLRRGQSGPVNALQKRQMGIIYSASLGLMSMANGLLELLGGEAPVRGEPSPFAVGDLLDRVCDLARPVADEKGLALHLRRPRGEMRLGHPQELSRVLVNLATNALKFTESGFVEVAATAVGGDRMEFSVRDTGPGLSADALGSLYQPFRPAQPGRHFTFSGSGLGLAICRKLVEGMGSTLQCETVPDWGTRFFFRLELPPADPAN